MAVVAHSVEGRPRSRGYSEATSAAGLACISGQLPSEAVLEGQSTFADQFVSALRRFSEVVTSLDAQPEDILLLRIYVTDMHAYHEGAGEFGSEYKSILEGRYPASTLVQVAGLVDARAMVEIEGLVSVRG
jgi:enamine deaminase RidA (YjgF/YER057c/UK114 family)